MKENKPGPVIRLCTLILVSIATIATVITGQVTERPRTTATPKPTVTPVATPAPAATPSTAQFQTLEGLQTKIRQRLFDTAVRRGRVGIKIVSLNSGKVVFENESEKYYMPASNMKNFTVATAIERLGPNFRFVTDITATSPIEAEGVIKGNVRIYGRGDISMSTSFDPAFPAVTNYYRAVDTIVDKIVAAGVKKIDGDLIGDESYFQGFPIPVTWEWDDLPGYYGTEISALPMNDNVIDINVAASTAGSPCSISPTPTTQLVKIINKCTTGGSVDTVQITKLMNQNVVEVTGMLPGGKQKKESVSFSHVAELFVDLLKQRLVAKGVTVTGRSYVVNTPVPPSPTVNAGLLNVSLGQVESPPLSVIAAKTMKPSQNMYTETILWTLGEQVGRKGSPTADSSRLGLKVVKDFLTEIGIPEDGIVQYDGSGLSRHDLITPAAVVTLYSYMSKQSRNAQAWRDSLTIGGVDGTLRNRFKGTAAAGNIRGKTGTIDQVSALSGYMTTAGGEQIIISIVVNGVPIPGQRTSLIDAIVVDLANFNGKID